MLPKTNAQKSDMFLASTPMLPHKPRPRRQVALPFDLHDVRSSFINGRDLPSCRAASASVPPASLQLAILEDHLDDVRGK